MSVREIVDALGEQAGELRLVVLAACDSDLIAAELAKQLRNVVGIRGGISDEGCLAFLRGLYRALGSGSTIDQAVAAGRAQQIFSQSLGAEWALPVLFQTDRTPVVLPRDVPAVSPPEAQSTPSVGTAEEKTDQILLQMKVSNLKMLRAQWSQVDERNLPSFIRNQIDDLEGEVQRITRKRPEPTR